MAKNQKAVPTQQVNQVLDQMKYEIASELGIQTGADQTARNNGRVGGQMTKRLIQIAESTIAGGR
jgi:small acid-soluble spore protein A (major alpha-type SASP)